MKVLLPESIQQKMSQHCPDGLRILESTDDLWTRIIQHSLHPHLWVRTLSARLVGTLLDWHEVEDVANAFLIN
jgi:hypothetical protein